MQITNEQFHFIANTLFDFLNTSEESQITYLDRMFHGENFDGDVKGLMKEALINNHTKAYQVLSCYMAINEPDRQDFIRYYCEKQLGLYGEDTEALYLASAPIDDD